MTAATGIESDVWQAEGYATRIEYSRVVIDELRIAATDGFNRLAHGGVEIGGVLFGVGNSDSIEILAHKPLTCEYAFGPSFTLSENDKRALENLLASAPADPELTGMQAVGWYHSHTRSEISLSEKDLQLYQRYFPEIWQVALVLRPYRFDPVRAGFFFRERDGSVHAGPTRREFIIHPPRRKPSARVEADDEPVDSKIREAPVALAPLAPQPVLEQASASPEPEPKASEPEERGRTAGAFDKVRWIWRAASIALVSLSVLYWIANLRPASRLSLRAMDMGGQLRIEWSSDARAARNSVSAVLEIEDGSLKVRNELSKDQIRSGSVTYMRNTGNVLVRMVVRGPDQAITTETARFLGSPMQVGKTPAADTTEPPIEERVAIRQEVVSSPSRPAEQAPSKEQLDSQLPPIKEEVHSQPETPQLTSDVPAKSARRLVVPETRNVVRSRGVDVVPPDLPAVASNIAPALPELLPRLPVPELPKPVYQGPLEGKIIWAGKLARHGTIQIQGSHASQGYITGRLPGVPVRVQVFPAEFTAGGLRIFTTDSKTTGYTEAPGAQNGWNRATYVWSPSQADRLRVMEAPSPQNAWNRVMLRAERGEQSIIVLRWELATAGSSVQTVNDR